MKIVHVETGRSFYGGPQQVTWLIRGLDERGVDSVLVCPPDSRISAVARQEGISVSNIPCGGDADFAFAWRLARFLRQEKGDLLHCHSRRGADFPGGWAATIARKRAVLTRRVDSFESPSASAIRYAPFQRVVAISDNVEAVLQKSRVREGKLRKIRSAVDVDALTLNADRSILEREFDIGPNAFAIAVVAQLIKRKGHRFLLDVLPGLLAEHPGIKAVFFGEGSGEAQLKALASKLGLSGAVRFAGFRDDLDEYLSAFDLLVHPAEQEALGVAMLKASAVGLPVIAFDIPGSNEAVDHTRTGILVPPGDFSELQKAIGVLVEDPAIGTELGTAGRQRMRDDFSVASMVERYLELYEEVLDE